MGAVMWSKSGRREGRASSLYYCPANIIFFGFFKSYVLLSHRPLHTICNTTIKINVWLASIEKRCWCVD